MPDIDHTDCFALSQSLLQEAGRLMEDACPGLALTLPDNAAALDERIAVVESVADDLASLASAARTLFLLNHRSD